MNEVVTDLQLAKGQNYRIKNPIDILDYWEHS